MLSSIKNFIRIISLFKKMSYNFLNQRFCMLHNYDRTNLHTATRIGPDLFIYIDDNSNIEEIDCRKYLKSLKQYSSYFISFKKL